MSSEIIHEIANAARAVFADEGLPELAEVKQFETAATGVISALELTRALKERTDLTGWLAAVSPDGSQVFILPDQRAEIGDHYALDGEFKTTGGASLRITRSASGVIVHSYGRDATKTLKDIGIQAQTASRADYLVETTSRRNRRGGRKLVYRIFWRPIDGFGLRQAFATFEGFGGDSK